MKRSVVTLALSALVVAGTACSSSASSGHPIILPPAGSGSGSSSAPGSSVPSSSPPSSFPSSEPPSSTPGGAASSTAGNGTGCPAGAADCATFTGSAAGWSTINTQEGFANYSTFEGGSYQIGERGQEANVALSPFKVSLVAPDYSIQLDTDVLTDSKTPTTGGPGLVCWSGRTDSGASTGFVFTINQRTATIGLWDSIDGSYHKIKTVSADGVLLYDNQQNHLTATCIQGTHDGGASAQLSLEVNGAPVMSAAYDQNEHDYPWKVADGVGVLAVGQQSNLFYDNFAITSKCESYC